MKSQLRKLQIGSNLKVNASNRNIKRAWSLTSDFSVGEFLLGSDGKNIIIKKVG